MFVLFIEAHLMTNDNRSGGYFDEPSTQGQNCRTTNSTTEFELSPLLYPFTVHSGWTTVLYLNKVYDGVKTFSDVNRSSTQSFI